MNARIKLFTMVGTVLAAGAVAAFPMLASASDGDIDIKWFVGATTSLSPAVQLVGGTGTYSFTTAGLVCEDVVSSDGPEVFQSCTASSSGSYSNTVCGTGSANGTATDTEPDGASETENIAITFVAGLGIVTGAQVVGVVQLLPTSPATPPACVTGFTVIGDVIITG